MWNFLIFILDYNLENVHDMQLCINYFFHFYLKMRTLSLWVTTSHTTKTKQNKSFYFFFYLNTILNVKWKSLLESRWMYLLGLRTGFLTLTTSKRFHWGFAMEIYLTQLNWLCAYVEKPRFFICWSDFQFWQGIFSHIAPSVLQ